MRDARRLAGLTQAEVAARAGTTQSYLSRVETGAENPSLSAVEAYAKAIGGAASVIITTADVPIAVPIDPAVLDSIIETLVTTVESLTPLIDELRAQRAKIGSV